MSNALRVAVVGAGWSGLAAAVHLARAGLTPTLLDAAPQPGGRARRVEVELAGRRRALDNGQHLLIGAYRATLDLMRSVGADPERLLHRLPFTLAYPDGFRLRAPAWPAPWHLAGALLGARGLPWAVRLAVVHAVRTWQVRGWIAPAQLSAADLLAGHPAEAIDRLWQPLCLAALNVRLAEAAAPVFLAVMRDTLGAHRAASDLMVPVADLSSVLPDAALRWLADRGVAARFGCHVAALHCDAAEVAVHVRGEPPASYAAVILALPPWRAAPLLPVAAMPALQAAQTQLQAMASAPIATVYLDYGAVPALPAPVMALREDPARGHPGQWLFDRGAFTPADRGLVSVVVSGAGRHAQRPLPELAAAVAAQLGAVLGWPAPRDARALIERRATIVPAPGLVRPPPRLLARLYLAGDAADSEYPSTLEGSVRSGLAAAAALLHDLSPSAGAGSAPPASAHAPTAALS